MNTVNTTPSAAFLPPASWEITTAPFAEVWFLTVTISPTFNSTNDLKLVCDAPLLTPSVEVSTHTPFTKNGHLLNESFII